MKFSKEELQKASTLSVTQVRSALRIAAKAATVPLITEWKTQVRQKAYKTGTYMRSIHAEEAKTEGADRVVIEVGTDITDPPYPLFLEYGTKRMEPRPTARPAFEASKDAMAKEAEEVFRILIRKKLTK